VNDALSVSWMYLIIDKQLSYLSADVYLVLQW